MKKYLVVSLFFIFGVVLGFWGEQKYHILNKEKYLTEQFKQTALHPAVDSMHANVSGIVKQKEPDYFVLESDGETLTIYLEEATGLTSFTKRTNLGSENIHYEDIKTGDSLKGGISIISNPESAVGLSKPRNPGDIIGQNFTVTRL